MLIKLLRRTLADEALPGFDFSVLNPERLIRKLRVEKRASHAGASNHPQSSDKEYDANQQRVLNHFRSFLTKINPVVDSRIKRDQIKRDECRQRIDTDRLEECVAETEHQLSEHKRTFKDLLVRARQEERQAKRDLNRFRTDNNLTREAVYPDSWMPYAYLVMLVAAEAIANAQFFSVASWEGWLGGFLMALLVSIFNVMLSASAGIGLRGVNHVSTARQVTTVIGIAAYASIIVCFHLVFASYRAELATNQVQPGTITLPGLLHAPFENWDVYALLLFGVGILFALAALVKGYRLDDSYPGYGAVTRRSRKACNAYIDMRAAYTRAIFKTTADMVAKVDQRVKDARKAMGEFRDSLGTTANLIGRYNTVVMAITETANVLLARYQSINTEVRDTPPPAYFGKRFHFGKEELIDFPDLEEERKTQEGFSEQTQKLEGSAEKAKTAIRSLSRGADNQVDVYFESIEVTADANISRDAPGTGTLRVAYSASADSQT
jgi:hypothetical protein